ncbi:MAG: hypothetical protein L3J66_05800 [Bacteroidales bacterium]|nr:hypothetical protein [Bacteroidales bacterium]
MMIKTNNRLIKPILLVYLLAMAFSATAQPEGIKLSQPWVFSNSFTKALYKAELTAYGNDLSGLLFVKRTGDGFRFIFLSEIGLKYFDVEINRNRQESYIVHSMMTALKRQALLTFFETTFRMLTMSWGEHREKYSFVCEGSGNRVQVIKSKEHGKFRFDYHPNFGQVSLLWHYGVFIKKLTIEPSGYDYKSPQLIVAGQKKIQFRLEQIEQ